MENVIFNYLSKIFNENGFRLYMIGGTSRDFLLNVDFDDYDLVSDATPEDVEKFLDNVDMTFSKYGTVKVKINGIKVDIITFRIEGNYVDYRHPSFIKYVKTLEEDYVRRDFTINAIYIDEKYNSIDPSNGLEDLKNKTIRFIGNPEERIKEDPLRILRAERFAKKLNFKIEERSRQAIEKYRYLLDKLNPQKVKEEARKEK